MIRIYKRYIFQSETNVENESEAGVESIDPAEIRRMRALAKSMRYIADA